MKIASILLVLATMSSSVQPIVQMKEASNIDNAKILAKHTHAIMAAAKNANDHGKNAKKAAKEAAHDLKKAG